MRPVVFALAALAAAATSCDREPLDDDCPAIQPGELVVSELRGEQTGDDGWGQYIELYNPSPTPLTLTGLRVRLLRIDGGSGYQIVVRERALELPPGGYLVLGQPSTTDAAPHIDYDVTLDLYDHANARKRSLFSTAELTVLACGATVDRVVYRDLPRGGSLALDGALTPNAAINDDADLDAAEARWCVDDTPVGGARPGLPGTPGESNRVCAR